jgi:hypothetical protein
VIRTATIVVAGVAVAAVAAVASGVVGGDGGSQPELPTIADLPSVTDLPSGFDADGRIALINQLQEQGDENAMVGL